ncbi:MAG: NlpC/P60 family protein [Hyphomicrobiales bacterium]|nr:NlpC/P60 family protein [Hyphomicrobiales bacterium]
MTQLDGRLNAHRPDLADIRLEGQVSADRYTEGWPAAIAIGAVPLRADPGFASGIDTEALFGETVRIFDVDNEWAWVQIERDAYVGYCPADALDEAAPKATHRVKALRAPVYPGPELKLPPVDMLPMNAACPVLEEAETRDTPYVRISETGWVAAAQLAPVDAFETDFVAVAERFTCTPYLWGGKTSIGLDCSGIVQTALHACGMACPRDTDMQEEGLGRMVEGGVSALLQRGDLVFWKGHVGIMRDGESFLHANGFHMEVASEPLEEAVARIADTSFGLPTSVKRL